MRVWTSHDSGGGARALKGCGGAEGRAGAALGAAATAVSMAMRGRGGGRRREEGGLCALILLQSDSIPSENGFFNASISCFENAN